MTRFNSKETDPYSDQNTTLLLKRVTHRGLFIGLTVFSINTGLGRFLFPNSARHHAPGSRNGAYPSDFGVFRNKGFVAFSMAQAPKKGVISTS